MIVLRINEAILSPRWYRIAEQVGCSQSAISQEIARNSINGVYDFKKAQELADSRISQRSKPILGDKGIQEFIIKELKQRRSPEQISRLAERQGIQEGKSSIYNFINQNPELKKYRKNKKYRKRSKYQASRHGIPDRVSKH
jgi:IS30 family transposase